VGSRAFTLGEYFRGRQSLLARRDFAGDELAFLPRPAASLLRGVPQQERLNRLRNWKRFHTRSGAAAR
jgi:hypothetical protein